MKGNCPSCLGEARPRSQALQGCEISFVGDLFPLYTLCIYSNQDTVVNTKDREIQASLLHFDLFAAGIFSSIFADELFLLAGRGILCFPHPSLFSRLS